MTRAAIIENDPNLPRLRHEPDVSRHGEAPERRASRAWAWRDAIHYCSTPSHLKRTILIALCVGLLLVVINQLGVILAGHAGAATWLRCGLDFVVPFAVSNLGLLAGYGEDSRLAHTTTGPSQPPRG